MNYYRRYVGDYLRDTARLTMLEHGAYTLMLDYIYADQKPLPLERAELYLLLRAMTAEDRKAVDRVLALYFTWTEEGYINPRAEAEMQRAQAASEVAAENGKKGGRPKKEPSRVVDKPVQKAMEESTAQSKEETNGISNAVSKEETGEENYRAGDPTTNHQPPTTNHQEKPQSSSIDNFHQPLALADAKINPETPSGILASVCVANSIRATGFHPLVLDWARDGITVQQLKAAIATARLRKPLPQNIALPYLDPILRDTSKPVDSSWRRDDRKAVELATELGIPGPKRGEETTQFHGRISEALADRARQQVAG